MAETAVRGHAALPALGWVLRASSTLVWFPAVVLLILLASVAALPAGIAAMAVWDGAWPAWAMGVRVVVAVVFGYGTFVITFAAVVAVARLLLGLRGREADVPVRSSWMFPWYVQLLSTYAVMTVSGPVLQSLGLMRWFARAMGMRLGRGTLINSRNLYDLDLIHLGDQVLVGGDAYLVPHVVEHGRLIRRRITIGDGASIGLHAVVLPGACIGRNCHVGALSLVPKDAVLDDDAVYAGVPVRKVRDL